MPEPRNKHDPNAVRVDVAGRTVGYLCRDIAEDYQGPLLEFTERGEVGWCEARITGGGDRLYGVFLLLADPEDLIPVTAPDGMTVLPGERPVTVTREKHHQDVLEAVSRAEQPSGGDLFASLDVRAAATGKHAGTQVVEVRIDGQRVGELTRTMSDRYLPAVRRTLAAGNTPGCSAVLESTDRGWQVELLLPAVD